MKINKQCLVLIHVLSCFIYLPGHCHCLHLILNYQFDIHITFRYFPLGRRNLKNGVFTLKKHQMFSFHTPLEEFKTQPTITGHPGREFLIEENSGMETTNYLDVIVFEKLRFQNGFRLHAKPPFFKFLLLVRCDIQSNTR